MISLLRIKALWLRHLYPLRRDLDLLSDMIYWPLVDTLLWGITGQWLDQTSGVGSIMISLVLSLIFWNLLWRAQSEVSRNLIDEIWNNNLVNLFSTPLTLNEWVVGVVGLSVAKTAVTLSALSAVVLGLYQVNIVTLGWWLPVLAGLTMMTGWVLGFVSAGIVIRFGPKVQTIVWTLPGILLPLSAIYFPLSQLPAFIQPISRIIPSTYVFETMRSLASGGGVNLYYLATSLILNLIGLIGAIWFFKKSFRSSLDQGLQRFN